MLTAAELHDEIADGAIDTVLVVFPDLQGRLVGKRVTGHFWAEQMQGGHERDACNYLLAVDVDMNPLSGYQFANWEQGYGDFAVPPDLSTLRRIPWLERPRSCCATSSTRRPASRSRCRPAGSSNARSSAPPTLGYTVMFGVGARVLPVPRVDRRGGGEGLRGLTPHSQVIEDYHILQTTRDEYLIRADPQRHGRRGRAGRVLEGRGRPGPARDQPRATPTRSRWPTAT